MRRAAWLALLLIAAGCASRPSGPEPKIDVVQTSRVAEVARNATGDVPIQYRVTIENTLTTPVTLKRLDLQSVGSGAYDLRTITRSYDEAIAAGASKTYDLWGPATVTPTISGVNGPVTLRVLAQYVTATGSFQTVAMRQVSGN